jgi:hypothetical protein
MSALAAESTKNKRTKLKMPGKMGIPASLTAMIKGDAADQKGS